jgi:two-component system, OmpR family, phosphate regulon response regulator PhoB
MPSTKVLIVEDDRSLVEVLQFNLTREGYNVTAAFDGQDGLNQARLKLPDVILLDVMLPVVDGLEVCKKLRASQETRDAIVVMLTAKSEETDQLIGFSVGADDYVCKPFSIKVLLERVKALVRRKERETQLGSDVVSCNGITIDRIKHRVSIDGNAIDLTPSEFRLLDTLIRQPGRAFDRSELIDAALGADTLVLERTIDVHVRALRKKLGRAADSIQTVRGVGYRFKETSELALSDA